MKYKRGMSGIIITIIMIAFALVLIGVVWAVISNIISESSEDSESTASQLFSTAAELGLIKMEKGQSCYGTEVVCKDGLACDGIVPDQISGLVGYWNFDGDARDSSGEGNHGEIIGNPQFVDGVAGEALEFDGVDDYVNCGADDSLNLPGGFSYVAWVKKIGGYAGTILGAYGGNYIGPMIYNDSTNAYRFQLGEGPTSVQDVSGGTITDEWKFLVGTYDGSTMHFFINGEEVGTPVSCNAVSWSGQDFTIAKYNWGAYYMKGSIDEVRIYNRALTEDEIAALYELP